MLSKNNIFKKKILKEEELLKFKKLYIKDKDNHLWLTSIDDIIRLKNDSNHDVILWSYKDKIPIVSLISYNKLLFLNRKHLKKIKNTFKQKIFQIKINANVNDVNIKIDKALRLIKLSKKVQIKFVIKFNFFFKKIYYHQLAYKKCEYISDELYKWSVNQKINIDQLYKKKKIFALIINFIKH